MKKVIYLLGLFCCCFILGQKIDTIQITQFKTTQIIFDKNINFVEAGTGDLQVKYKIVDNILILQSIVGEDDFINTNLFIKTDDSFYNPIIGYKKNPKYSTILEKSLQSAFPNVEGSKVVTTEKEKAPLSKSDLELFKKIMNQKEESKGSRSYETGMWVKFYAHYIINNKVYFKIGFENATDLDYNIEHLFFSIKTRKKGNASVTQKEVTPNRVINKTDTIKGKQQYFMIYEFSPFSINRDEEVIVEVKEKNGARNFVFGIPNQIINRPIKLN
ncbi:DUF4138 domain-containing protein [Riemerella anatipestifer]|nr:DUF4138 domain-containing protein [Riemerella anatipestifer]